MQIKNMHFLKINSMSQKQFEREKAAGNIEGDALYLTPEETSMTVTIDGDKASHTSAEIYAHVQSGGTVVLLKENQYYPWQWCTEGYVSFQTMDDVQTVSGIVIYHDATVEPYNTVLVRNDDWVEKITRPSIAKVGQTIVVSAVDRNGKPTEWEAADLPSGGGDNLMLFCIDNTYYLAKVGMTWGEWCDSQYNIGIPNGVYIYDDKAVYTDAEDVLLDATDGPGQRVLPTDTIKPTNRYIT